MYMNAVEQIVAPTEYVLLSTSKVVRGDTKRLSHF